MKKSTIYAATILSLTLIGTALAQVDSGGVPPLRGNPRLLPLALQERETPVVNNTTQVTQNVTQQVTQVVQPNTYQVSASGVGNTTSSAFADCGGGTLLGGGGSCNDNQGLVAVAASQPNGNGWYVGCQSLNYVTVQSNAYAVCSAN